jgi:hypothetical protein
MQVSIVALEEGKCAHEHIIESAWKSYVYLVGRLVDKQNRGPWSMLGESST